MVVASAEKQHANVWAKGIWKTIQDVEAKNPSVSATIILNDDVICHPEMMRVVGTLHDRMAQTVLSLHGNFPLMRQHALRGARLLRCYWPSGPAMLFPRGFAGDLLEWLATIPQDWFAGDVNEDGAIAAFLWKRQTPTITTIPALVKHDVSVPSTLAGYDDHPNRTSWVPWLEEGVAGFPVPEKWDWDAPIPYVSVPWMSDPQMKQLGDYLRGEAQAQIVCALCLKMAAKFVDPHLGRGICPSCAGDLMSGLSQVIRMS